MAVSMPVPRLQVVNGKREMAIVAIVDDDAPFRRALVSLVKSFDLEPLDFETADAFLQSPERNRVRILVSDVQMPRMSGIELFERLQEDGDTTPVILISGNPLTRTRLAAEHLSAIPFFAKPIDGEMLHDEIRRLLAGGRRDE